MYVRSLHGIIDQLSTKRTGSCLCANNGDTMKSHDITWALRISNVVVVTSPTRRQRDDNRDVSSEVRPSQRRNVDTWRHRATSVPRLAQPRQLPRRLYDDVSARRQRVTSARRLAQLEHFGSQQEVSPRVGWGDDGGGRRRFLVWRQQSSTFLVYRRRRRVVRVAHRIEAAAGGAPCRR